MRIICWGIFLQHTRQFTSLLLERTQISMANLTLLFHYRLLHPLLQPLLEYMPRLNMIIWGTLGWLFSGMVSPILHVLTYKIVGGCYRST